MLVAALLVFLPTVLWAKGEPTFYAALETSVSSSGGGKVYADNTETENASKYGNTSYAKANGSKKGSSSSSTSASVTLYAFAKANYGKVLSGWSTSDGGTVVSGSSVNPFAVKISSSQQSSASPETKKYYAVFVDNPNSYTLTLNNPDGLSSYTVTAPSGFPKDLSHGGSATVYKGDQYTFKYNLSSDEYDFINWTVNGDVKTTASITVTISAATTINLTLKRKVTYYATFQASEGGSYMANNMLIQGSDNGDSAFGSVTVNLSNPVANDGYTFYGWYILHPNGVKEYLSYYTSASTGEKKENIVVGAEFRAVQNCTVNFVAPAEGKIAYAISGGNAGEVEDADKSEPVPAGADVTLTATSDFESRRAKWYIKDDSGEKVYISIDNPLTKKFSSSCTMGVDFVPVNTNIVKAIEAAQNHASKTAMLDADAEIVLGTSIEIPSDITIDLNGHTLYVDGTLIVNGNLIGGTVSECKKLLKQTGDGLSPCNPYGSIKYWKTSTVTPSASITWEGTKAMHVTIMRGDGVAIRKVYTVAPAVLTCKADATIAVNHITSIKSTDSNKTRTDDNLTCPYSKAPLSLTKNQKETSMLVIVDSGVSINGHEKDGDTSQHRYLYQGVVDCAGYDCGGMTTKTHSDHIVTYLNGGTISVAPGSDNMQVNVQNSTLRFVNCKKVNYLGKARNTPHYYFYDCELTLGSFSTSGNSGDSIGVCFLGGKYSYGFAGSTDTTYSRIYAGAFKDKPNKDKWVLEELKSTMSFYQHSDGYWYLEPTQEAYVAKVNGEKKYTLEEALSCLNDNDVVSITLLKDARIESPYTLEAGKSLVVELDGCHIDAPNGFIKNYGNLSIREKNNRLVVSGVTTGNGKNIVENYDGGTVDICYGVYNGNFGVNGGTFTTHHGRFNGSVVNNGGTMNLKGGVFEYDVSSLVNDGYIAFDYNGLYYVGRTPRPVDADSGLQGFARVLTAMPPQDKTLYLAKKTATLGECSDADEWKYVAELKATYKNLEDASFYIDILIGFDRNVESNTVLGEVVHPILGTKSEKMSSMTAGELVRIFSPRITEPYTQISYARFIDDDERLYDKMEAGVSDINNANKGTTCTLAMDLWKWDDSRKKTRKDSYLTIISLPYVFGAGSNKAMLQTAAGAVPNENFFATLTAAVASDATTGKTIKLCNDCAEEITVGKACTIDPNGFEFSGTLTAGEGLSMKTENGVYVFKSPDSADVYIGQVNVDTVVSDDWKTENGLDQNASEEDIQEALKQEDANELPKWENLVIGQNPDEKAAVTAANGGTETTVDVAVTFEVPKDKTTGEKIETGYAVKYAFDKVDTNGDVVENGEGATQDKPTLDIESVKAEDGPAYFKMRAVLEASDDSNVTTEVPVEKTIGVVKVASDAEVTIIPVPWQSLGDGDIKASELVHAASLSNGDELIVYGTDGKTQTWIVKNGEWTAPAAEYTIGGGDSEPQQVEAQDPAELKRGQGVILKRKDPSKEIVLIGQPVANETEKVETPIAAASANEPSWNLVASPKMAKVAVDAVAGENTSDEIIVPTAGTPKHYTYKEGKWGYTGKISEKTVRLPNGKTTTAVQFGRKTGDTDVPAGTGFWYLNKDSSNNSKTIAW